MASPRAIAVLALAISALFFVNLVQCTEEDEDLAFLEQENAVDTPHASQSILSGHSDADLSDSDSEADVPYGGEQEEGEGELEDEAPTFDESHVSILTDSNFTDFINGKRHVMVEFYAPWCGHCMALAPEYAAAAAELAGEGADVVLAKVDATEENDLSHKYEIQGFPTLLFFIDGVHRQYQGARSSEAIVTWIKKKIGPGVQNITTVEEAEQILNSQNKAVLGYLHSLVGSDSDKLSAASKLEDDVNFYQTNSADVAKLFHIDPKAKRPALVLVKKEEEKLVYFDGEFTPSKISEFVFNNKLALVTKFAMDTAQTIFDSPIKKQILLFVMSNETEEHLSVFQEAAKLFKGKLIFVYVERDNAEVGEPVSAYFGVTGQGPKVVAFSGNQDERKYMLSGELTLENVKKFAEGFLDDKLQPFYKSDPIPETNDEDVKIVVGNNFDEIVLDESKDVLLELYAPWCGHCQALEPIYTKLGKYLSGVESIVVAKMDGTSNEHPRAKADGFPTILFYPAGSKSFEPITYEGERTVVEFYKFLKNNASIPFKLKRPATTESAAKSEHVPEPSVAEAEKSTTADVKDEL